MNPKFDLLGHPIPENHGKAGANGHIVTPENVNKVRLLLIAGRQKKDIAADLGISIPTLTKHYFLSGAKEVKEARQRALADERAKNLLRLDEAASKGNVTAIRELNSILAAEAIKDRAREFNGVTEEKSAPARPAPRGKKEQQIDAAKRVLETDDLLDPRVH
ncbi:hypothetical protein [Thalassobius sp. I31.1]|uniref:hypothetical protein n=1 Tax=Thalassobius sp. I31.1 TaxID=2109912 RepID=UPI00130092C0|nr:hypothetical protein [Thalassobius sp. I31.1]